MTELSANLARSLACFLRSKYAVRRPPNALGGYAVEIRISFPLNLDLSPPDGPHTPSRPRRRRKGRSKRRSQVNKNSSRIGCIGRRTPKALQRNTPEYYGVGCVGDQSCVCTKHQPQKDLTLAGVSSNLPTQPNKSERPPESSSKFPSRWPPNDSQKTR